MSTHDFASGDHENLPDPGFGPAFETRIAEIARECQDLDPKVRELNRALTEIFGPRADKQEWAYLGRDENDVHRIFLTPVDPDEVLRLVLRVNTIIVDAEIDRAVVATRLYENIASSHNVIGEAARFRAVPSTHVKYVRQK